MDLDPLRILMWIRIRICIDKKCWIRIRIETNADPKQCLIPPESGAVENFSVYLCTVTVKYYR
jgi:hypothetical protein